MLRTSFGTCVIPTRNSERLGFVAVVAFGVSTCNGKDLSDLSDQSLLGHTIAVAWREHGKSCNAVAMALFPASIRSKITWGQTNTTIKKLSRSQQFCWNMLKLKEVCCSLSYEYFPLAVKTGIRTNFNSHMTEEISQHTLGCSNPIQTVSNRNLGESSTSCRANEQIASMHGQAETLSLQAQGSLLLQK